MAQAIALGRHHAIFFPLTPDDRPRPPHITGWLCSLVILLSAPFGSRSDKPAVTDPPPLDRTSVISELSIWVPDCLAACEVLRSRGAEFLTPPFDGSGEVRAFFLDPDGHLLEIGEARKAEVRSE